MSITNPTSDNLAQTAHALAGYGIALTAARFGTVPLLVVAGLFIAYAAIKEFWFDMHYETPEVSGGWEQRLAKLVGGVAVIVPSRCKTHRCGSKEALGGPQYTAALPTPGAIC